MQDQSHVGKRAGDARPPESESIPPYSTIQACRGIPISSLAGKHYLKDRHPRPRASPRWQAPGWSRQKGDLPPGSPRGLMNLPPGRASTSSDSMARIRFTSVLDHALTQCTDSNGTHQKLLSEMRLTPRSSRQVAISTCRTVRRERPTCCRLDSAIDGRYRRHVIKPGGVRSPRARPALGNFFVTPTCPKD
jgi:hypothetical protein